MLKSCQSVSAPIKAKVLKPQSRNRMSIGFKSISLLHASNQIQVCVAAQGNEQCIQLGTTPFVSADAVAISRGLRELAAKDSVPVVYPELIALRKRAGCQLQSRKNLVSSSRVFAFQKGRLVN